MYAYRIKLCYSDCWRDRKFCSVCFCSSHSCYSTWCFEHNCEVNPKISCCQLMLSIWSMIFQCSIRSLHSAVLAHIMLKERLHIFGILGCILCVVGSISIVLHAPAEREILSVKEVWTLATEPGALH